MNLSSVFGTILTILGATGLIYGGVTYVNGTEGTRALIVYSALGLIFFISGISLIKRSNKSSGK
jgi:hypothetical protein